jgi:predicted nucleic acid-binding protein
MRSASPARHLCEGRGAANLASDAHLAALALEHGLTLRSTDGDFARFPVLRWQDPLTS